MAASPIKDRLVPYKILGYLLYTEDKLWLETLGNGRVRLITGEAARFFRLKTSLLWEALYWLEKFKLITSVEKERKKGSVLITLREISR